MASTAAPTSKPSLAGGFQFIHLSGPDDAVKHRKQVRSHAAKKTKERHERVLQYQARRRGLVSKHDDHAAYESSSVYPSPSTSSEEINEAHGDLFNQSLMHLIPIRPAGTKSPSPKSPLGSAKMDPFNSFVRPMTPFEEFLLKHFISHVVLNDLSAAPSRTSDAVVSTNPKFCIQMGRSWTQTAACDPGMLAMVFLVSCRSLSRQQHTEVYEPLALGYKMQCLRLLNETLTAEGSDFTDMTITKTLGMASDELFSHNKSNADKHLRAAAAMIEYRGEPAQIGMWRHQENRHLWTHWEEVMTGWATDDICKLFTFQTDLDDSIRDVQARAAVMFDQTSQHGRH